MKSCLLSLLAISLAAPAFGDNLFRDGDAEDTNSWTPAVVTVVKNEKHGGTAAFSLKKPVTTVKSPLIPVDPSRKYRLSGFLKSADPKNQSTTCFGLAMFDGNKTLIQKTNVSPIQETETELAAPAAKGAMEILVKDASRWNKRRSARTQVAFYVKPGYADLPNFDVTSLLSRVKKTSDGNAWEVKFDRPLLKDYPAGTPVRQHTYGSSLDCCLAYHPVPGEWTRYSAEIGGQVPVGAPDKQFWNGVKYVAVFFMADASRKGAELLFDDIVFEEVK